MPAALLSIVLLSVALGLRGAHAAAGAAGHIPPLTDAQIGRLETAHDGRDHREEAFVALVENAAGFTGHGPAIAGSAPVRLDPDFDELLADPDTHRGDLCRIDGILQQSTILARPHAAATEWFIRDATGRPVIVYVVGLTPRDHETFVPDRRVVVYARFYKRVDAEARDGAVRQYAAFVGARPWLPSASGGGSGILVVLVVVLGGLGAIFVLLVALTRRQQRRVRPRVVGYDDGDTEELDGQPPLPDDPAEALAELKRRAGERS